METKLNHRKRENIIDRLTAMVADLELDLRSQDHWNETHPGEPPITVLDDLRPFVAQAKAILARDPGYGPIEPLPELPPQ